MDVASLPSPLQALMPGAASTDVGSHDAAQGGGTALERLVAQPAPALADLPPTATLPPSLHEALSVATAAGAAAADFTPGNVPPALAPASGQPPAAADPSRTLQQMAQATTHVDLAAERHGRLAAAAVGGAAAAADPGMPSGFAGLGASAPGDTAPAPLASEALMTPVVASLLHVPAAPWRRDAAEGEEPTRRNGRDPGDEAANDHDGEDEGEDMAADPHGNGLVGSGVDGAGRLSAPPTASVPGRVAPAGPDAAGDPHLYQRLVCALTAARDEDASVQVALDELRRHRRVVVASPAGSPVGLRMPVHVDVLCPQAGAGRAVRLRGELLWSRLPAGPACWRGAHFARAQAEGHVRRLEPVGSGPEARQVAVTLGAQAVPMTAWSDACLRVRDGTRLWQALEPQWSLRLLIGTTALNDPDGGRR